jgi:uncharacterized membrane protein YfcA
VSVAAFGVGMAKAGLSGLGLFAVILFASLFGARDSTGVLLPLLLVADLGAVSLFKQHARWDSLRQTLPLAAVGVVIGTLIMHRMNNDSFRPLLGTTILVLTGLQLVRRWRPDVLGRVPHSRPVAVSLGLTAGITTMLANAAGPLMALYYVSIGLPKFEIVGTTAWFFFLLNIFKLPFSLSLGVMDWSTIAFDAVLTPAVLLGLLLGRWVMHRISQRLFEGVLLAFAAIAALRLIL